MYARDIIDRAERILHDEENVRWTTDELIDYINDAEEQIVEVKPTANTLTANIQLAAGTPHQNIPVVATKMHRLVRNMGPNGDQPGRAIILTSRAVLDSMDIDWPRRSGTEIEHWVYDPNADRDVFWVTPYPVQSIRVEAVYVGKLLKAQQASDGLNLGDQYINQVLDWVLYRAFSKDADYGSSSQRAQQHLQSFSQALGIKMQTMQRTDPNITRRGGETMGRV